MNCSRTPAANFLLALASLTESLVIILSLGYLELSWRWQLSKTQFIRDLELNSMKGWDG